MLHTRSLAVGDELPAVRTVSFTSCRKKKLRYSSLACAETPNNWN